MKNFLTPTEVYYVRCHSLVPQLDPSTYVLKIQGEVETALKLTLKQLREEFRQVNVVATQVSESLRRHELLSVQAIPNEPPQLDQCIGNAVYTGVSLRSVLERAGVKSSVKHVITTGYDKVTRNLVTLPFETSISLEKALSPEVILAYEMNGQPLPEIHGGPLRLVVPGYFSARWVQWIDKITLSPVPSQGYFQKDFQVYPASAKSGNLHWADPASSDGPIEMNEFPVNCAIMKPSKKKTYKKKT